MGTRFIKIATLYLAIGVTMGMVMGMTGKFTLMPVHAHVNLLGWASLALVGVVYQLYPEASRTRLAKIHFWLHNLGLPPLMIALAFLLSGNEALEPVVGIASLVVGCGIFIFVINVWMTLKPADESNTTRVAAVVSVAR
jgi:hypothetical protein